MKNKFLFPFVTATPMRTLLSLITIITGALQANAVQYELVPSYIGNAFQGNYNWSFIGSSSGIPAPADGGDRDLITDVPQNGNTFASSPAGSVKSTYKVLPSGFSGSSEFVIPAESEEVTTVLTVTVITFRPTIDLYFDFEDSYTEYLDHGAFQKWAGLNKDLSFPVNTGPTVFGDVHANNGNDTKGLVEYSFSTSGILFAGQIAQFETRSQLDGGVNTNDFPLDSTVSGSWSLKFRPAKSVPDAGSTLAMLGMALSVLGGMARLRAVCF